MFRPIVCCSVCAAILAPLLVVPVSSADKPKSVSPEVFIRRWVETINRNRPDELIAHYDASEQTELLVSNGKSFRGPKQIAEAYTHDSEKIRYYDSEAAAVRSRMLGDEVAVVSFEHRLKFRVVSNDERYQIHVRTTSVLHRIKGKWKITLEHSSPIEAVERIKRIDNE